MTKTYTTVVPAEIGLHSKSAELLVEVEFTMTPYVPAKFSGPPEDCYEAYGGEVEIVGVRIFAEAPADPKARVFLDSPQWLLAMIEECIDLDDLAMSVEPDEGPDPDDARDRRIDEALMYGDEK